MVIHINLNTYKGENPYQLALNECDLIMASGKHSLNSSYKSQFLNYIQNVVDFNESIFEIAFNNLSNIGVNTSGNLGTRNGLYFFHYDEIEGANIQIYLYHLHRF